MRKDLTLEEIEKELKRALKYNRDDMKNYANMGMDAFMSGRYAQTKLLCEQFGISVDEDQLHQS